MNPQFAQPRSTQTQPASTSNSGLPRCRHRTPAGRHCRAEARDSRSGLCPRHYLRPAPHQPDPVLASELLGSLTEFQSASQVNLFLSRLLLLLAQDRLSPRRGAVMAYTCNLILRSLHAIDIENKIADSGTHHATQEGFRDLVRPKREDDPPPPPSHPIMPITITDRPQT